MHYWYREYESPETIKATQREVIDLILDGASIQVARFGTNEWVDGDVYIEKGDDAFRTTPKGVTDYHLRRLRGRILGWYTTLAALLAIVLAFVNTVLILNRPFSILSPHFFMLALVIAWFYSLAKLWDGQVWAWVFNLIACLVILGVTWPMISGGLRLVNYSFSLLSGIIATFPASPIFLHALFCLIFLIKHREIIVIRNIAPDDCDI